MKSSRLIEAGTIFRFDHQLNRELPKPLIIFPSHCNRKHTRRSKSETTSFPSLLKPLPIRKNLQQGSICHFCSPGSSDGVFPFVRCSSSRPFCTDERKKVHVCLPLFQSPIISQTVHNSFRSALDCSIPFLFGSFGKVRFDSVLMGTVKNHHRLSFFLRRHFTCPQKISDSTLSRFDSKPDSSSSSSFILLTDPPEADSMTITKAERHYYNLQNYLLKIRADALGLVTVLKSLTGNCLSQDLSGSVSSCLVASFRVSALLCAGLFPDARKEGSYELSSSHSL